jgi:integrase
MSDDRRLTLDLIARAKDGVLSERCNLKGCALEIHVRRGGKSKQAYFRYNGVAFNEQRNARLRLGSYDKLGLAHLRRECITCEDLIQQNKSPNAHYAEKQEHIRKQHTTAKRTLREAMNDFFAWAGGDIDDGGNIPPARWKSPKTRRHNRGTKKNHLDNAPIMDMPLLNIEAHHLDEFLAPLWHANPITGTKGQAGVHVRSLLHSTFRREIRKKRYVRLNPASWCKDSDLTELLGDQPRSTPHPAALYTDIPRVIAHLRDVRKLVPGYLTIAEAAYALGRDPNAIRAVADRDGFPGMITRPHHNWSKSCRFIPIPELKARFGEFKHEPIPLERADIVSNCELLQAIIYTVVRPSMMCELRWGQFKEIKGYRYIEYQPARDGRPSEHKNGWKYDYPYLVMQTDNLSAIFETQRQQQIRDGLKIEPNGLVFRHARTHTGGDHWFGHGIGHRTLSDYLHRIIKPLDIKKKDMTPAGMRRTFGTWAKDEHGYSDELIDMTLGHIIPGIRNTQSNWSYLCDVTRLRDRHAMMKVWEQHCLSLCKPKLALVPKSA